LPSAVVPTKLPFSTLLRELLSIRMPFCVLPDTRLPSGGTTKTGGVEPLLPVGSFCAPVLVSVNAVPPISFPLEPLVSRMPLPPLAIATVPVGSVPM
jgi:hypothetical protein